MGIQPGAAKGEAPQRASGFVVSYVYYEYLPGRNFRRAYVCC